MRDRSYVVQMMVLAVGLALLWTWALQALDSNAYQRRAGAALDQARRASAVEEMRNTAPLQQPPGVTVGTRGAAPGSRRATVRGSASVAGSAAANTPSSEVIGRLVIPSAGISGVIGEGVDDQTLRRAIGHLPRSPLPGAAGNVSLAGHRDTFFRGLGRVRRGDPIRIQTARGTFVYRVTGARVVGQRAVGILDATRRPTLTLITCYPFDYVGPAPSRWVVRAELVGSGEATAVLTGRGRSGSAGS